LCAKVQWEVIQQQIGTWPVRVCTYVCMYSYICMYVYVRMYVCMYVCVFLSSHFDHEVKNYVHDLR